MTNEASSQVISRIRELAFPNMTLCHVSFNDGTDTNDFVPNEVLNDTSISIIDWWNEARKNDFVPLMQGKFRAVSVTPVKPQ